MGRYDILLQQEQKPEPAKPVLKPADAQHETHEAPSRSDAPDRQSAPAHRPHDRTVERANGKRIITRNSFEIYEDQMDSLRKLSYREKLEGKLGSMSAMVRDAIDTYLKKNAPH